MISQHVTTWTRICRRKQDRSGLDSCSLQGQFFATLLLVSYDESVVAKVRVRGWAFCESAAREVNAEASGTVSQWGGRVSMTSLEQDHALRSGTTTSLWICVRCSEMASHLPKE